MRSGLWRSRKQDQARPGEVRVEKASDQQPAQRGRRQAASSCRAEIGRMARVGRGAGRQPTTAAPGQRQRGAQGQGSARRPPMWARQPMGRHRKASQGLAGPRRALQAVASSLARAVFASSVEGRVQSGAPGMPTPVRPARKSAKPPGGAMRGGSGPGTLRMEPSHLACFTPRDRCAVSSV